MSLCHHALRRSVVAATTVVVLLMNASGTAHHSAAMFDTSKCSQVTGTVRNFQMQYPHSWVWLFVPDNAGVQQIWGFESISPTQLLEVDARWSKALLKKGDKVTVEFRPLRDGRNGGLMQSIVLPDGSLINGWKPVNCPLATANLARQEKAGAAVAPAKP